MAEPRKFYRTVVSVEVLTAGAPPAFDDLGALHWLITDGPASGSWEESSFEVTEAEMRQLLENQGSDPDFLTLGDDERATL